MHRLLIKILTIYILCKKSRSLNFGIQKPISTPKKHPKHLIKLFFFLKTLLDRSKISKLN
jgi:hypothetical protein